MHTSENRISCRGQISERINVRLNQLELLSTIESGTALAAAASLEELTTQQVSYLLTCRKCCSSAMDVSCHLELLKKTLAYFGITAQSLQIASTNLKF